SQGGAERIESLGQVQPARGGPFRSEDGDVRIGRDLQHGEAEADDKEGRQEKRIGEETGRGPKERATYSRDHQADHNAVLVAKPRDGIADRGRNREVEQRADEVSAEERELDEHGMEVI